MKLDLQNVKKIFDNNNLSFVFKKDNIKGWNNIITNFSYTPVAYTNKSIEYENYYSFDNSEEYLDISIIISLNNKSVGIWPLTISHKKDNFQLTSQGQSILPPLFLEEINKKERKKLVLKCYNSLNFFFNEYNIDKIKSNEIFLDKQIHSISEWHRLFLDNKAKITINYTMFACLSGGIDKYRKSLRKSYKPLINQGLKIWKVKKLFNDNKSIWTDFKELHYRVSSGKTRSEKTWQRQYDSIIIGEAFLIYLLNDTGEMIGGGYFTLSQNEAVYSIGAYDRKLFDKPIGHVIQYEAIQEFIKRNIDWYKIGMLTNYEGEVSAKDKSIQVFKNGFASHIIPEYVFNKHF